MSATVLSEPYLTVEEYLAREERSQIKYEYLDGVIHAMAGASEAHNRIASTLNRILGNQLRGRSCEPFGSDMQVKIRRAFSEHVYFYYADGMIACEPDDTGHGWRERPAVLFEIISESTRQIDEREKRAAYLQIDSLQAYIRIEQDRAEVIVERRTPDGWRAERIIGLEGVIQLPVLNIELPLAELYERVTFPSSSASGHTSL